ncbi:unnamed protein product, partial [Leptidea sinapis]
MKIADNINPNVYERGCERERTELDYDENVTDDFDEREIFDLIRNISDPEHPLTLEELRVVEEGNIKVDNKDNIVHIYFTPTIPHCSMATLIEGTHVSEHAVNKQLADKERIAAALENNNLVQIIN